MHKNLRIGWMVLMIMLLAGTVPELSALPLDKVVDTELANGLKVLLLNNDKAPVVSVQVWYKVGARNEPFSKSGLAHLTEHLMFRGTKKVGPKLYSRIIQKNGGQDNAFTSRDYTAYYENVSADRVAIPLELEADRMTGLSVDEEKFLTERSVVQEERRLRIKDDPVASLFEEVTSTSFKNHPYQHPVTGWMEDLEGLSHQDFLQFYRTFYQPANATLVVVGKIDLKTLLPAIEKTFGRVPKGLSPPPVIIKEPPQSAEVRVLLRREAELPYVVFAFHVPSYPHPDAFALEIMSQILAGGKSSRMYQKMVYEEQKVLEVGADYPFNSKDPFLFYLFAQALPGQNPEGIEERILKELDTWEKDPPSEEELRRAKNQLEAGFIFAQDSIFYQGLLLGKYQSLGHWKGLDQFLPGIRAVTQEDLLRVYRTYFKDKPKTVGYLIPLPSEQNKNPLK